MENGNKHITISDVAEALNVSKTTVSRAISGKGRIGTETRERVLAYIKEHDYKPNVIAKGLAQSKTFNLCVVIPGDYAVVDLPFFQEAIVGVQEIAGKHEYDILLCICNGNDIVSLKRIIMNRKVDGVILLRTLVEDERISFLKEKGIPFVTAGTTPDGEVVQVDHDHFAACKELTSTFLKQGIRNVAVLGGSESIVANRSRKRGAEEAFWQNDLGADGINIYMNLENEDSIRKALSDALGKHVECILCMDDGICSRVLQILRQEKIRIPQQIKVASFYNSSVLENNIPSITSLDFSARELGKSCCERVLGLIDGKEVNRKTLLPYEIMLKESTR